MKAISKFFSYDFEITLFLNDEPKNGDPCVILKKGFNLNQLNSWHRSEIRWMAFGHQDREFAILYGDMIKIAGFIAQDLDQLDLSQYILNGMPNPAITQKIEEIVKNNLD